MTYLKAAFANRWNLLAFAGALGFSMLSGLGDVLVPLVLAGEVLYIGSLAAHPKFQRYVEAQKAIGPRDLDHELRSEQVLDRMMAKLPKAAIERFDALRTRCIELRQIALELKDPTNVGKSPKALEEMQLAGLDRLLWIYLRLLFTEYSLEKFEDRTSAERLTIDIDRLQEQLEASKNIADNLQREKVRRALDDNIQTSRARLANFEKARDNLQIVKLEIDRLENKIRALSELAVNRQEPDFISAQVDEVASSMIQTEETINELQFATGLATADEAVPPLMQRQVVTNRI